MRGENEYHVTALDPGGNTGWAHFVVDRRAFSRPENKVLRWLKSWESGVLSGPEHDQLRQAVHMITDTVSVHGRNVSFPYYDVVSEDFDLVQTVGGKNLLSPVRINAVLGWECKNRAIRFNLQARQLRTGVTKERAKLFGFNKRFQKDEFAAVQHGITWLRLLKDRSRRKPWKLSDGVTLDSYWDCDCADGLACDMVHP